VELLGVAAVEAAVVLAKQDKTAKEFVMAVMVAVAHNGP
jgi:hypothetical protein